MTERTPTTESSDVSEAKDYRVIFSTKMPGATRATPYTVVVKAESIVEAVARAEAEWQRITSKYNVAVEEIEHGKSESHAPKE